MVAIIVLSVESLVVLPRLGTLDRTNACRRVRRTMFCWWHHDHWSIRCTGCLRLVTIFVWEISHWIPWAAWAQNSRLASISPCRLRLHDLVSHNLSLSSNHVLWRLRASWWHGRHDDLRKWVGWRWQMMYIFLLFLVSVLHKLDKKWGVDEREKILYAVPVDPWLDEDSSTPTKKLAPQYLV